MACGTVAVADGIGGGGGSSGGFFEPGLQSWAWMLPAKMTATEKVVRIMVGAS
jgi:hypothetical protein